MEVLLRLLQAAITFIYAFVYFILAVLLPRKRDHQIPPIKQKILTVPLTTLIGKLRNRKIKSVQIVDAYIKRIKEVNPHINAMVEDRFNLAMAEARRTDELIEMTPDDQMGKLFAENPLLGMPFTVKESCGLEGMPHTVGSLQRMGKKSLVSGKAVELLMAAGAIPLLVSANPEYCFSIETNSYTNGRCNNPYDSRRTSGGSSGGEGALNGAGASLFGVGSDIAGSIRIPALFNGVFGHKPTGNLVSVDGNFPNSSDPEYSKYLQVGPITRFAEDLELITRVMAGRNGDMLDLRTPIETKDIKIYYSLGFDGLNGLFHQSVSFAIQLSIMKAVKFFEQNGLVTKRAKIKRFRNSTEIALSAIVRIKDFPFLMTEPKPFKVFGVLRELMRTFLGRSQFTRDGLIFELMRRANSFMPHKNLDKYRDETDALRSEIVDLIGSDGVLLFPTFHVPAIHHYTSALPLWAIDYSLVFNAMGLPATHVPMGLDDCTGLPVGFQVVASPYMDRLCFQIAGELKAAFGGWKPPTPHQF